MKKKITWLMRMFAIITLLVFAYRETGIATIIILAMLVIYSELHSYLHDKVMNIIESILKTIKYMV